jgi:16S rRNA (adenine1518-N6/adenine1519-N6)-dimethyltransferase
VAVTHSLQQVRALLEAHGLEPSRALGQNFVADPNTVRRIVRLAELPPGQPVVEIGAGVGSLTLALLEAGAAVTAVELDRRLLPVLRELVEPLGARVVAGDALTLDWHDVLAGHDRWVLVANLPYNIAAPLVLDLLRDVPVLDRMLVMVQREVGERLAAGPGSGAYGIPSVKVAYWAVARVVGHVPATVFVPRPRVESVLVDIRRRPDPAVAVDRSVLFDLVDTAFRQRRKMLRRSLADRVDAGVFAAAGVAPEARPEQLGIEAWGRLAEAAVAAGGGTGP